MGALPGQQLALNFLEAVHRLWVQHPGRYVVEENVDDLVPALAQMCIKALAADVRGRPPADGLSAVIIDGSLSNAGQAMKGHGADKPLDLHDVLNKVIHGTPTTVLVQEATVQLHFRNSGPDRWTDAWFSGTQVLAALGRRLYKHPTDEAEERERVITEFLEKLGPDLFLPTLASRASSK